MRRAQRSQQPRQRGLFDPPPWGSAKEIETRRRILVTVAAYAYEIKDDPIWSDEKYDQEARLIDLNQPTGRPGMDLWFKHNFHPDTGMWVHHHPHRRRLNQIYKQIKRWRRK